MKQYLYIAFVLIGISFSLSSCEDPVELDLGIPVEQIVFDAVINQTTDTQFIYITRSKAFLDNSKYVGYQMDSVGLLDTTNMVFHTFTYKGDGIYFFVPPSSNTFTYGNTYQLIARDGVNTYFSQSTLYAPTSIDSFTYEYKERGSFGSGKGNYVTLWSKDKVGKGDYYWFKLYINDSLQSRANDIILAIDNAFNEDGNGDGDLFIIPIRENFNPRPYRSGETVRVEILSITPETYYFLNLVSVQLNNTGLFAVPATNIPSNIVCINNPDKKVLGFFSMAGKVSTQKLLFP